MTITDFRADQSAVDTHSPLIGLEPNTQLDGQAVSGAHATAAVELGTNDGASGQPAADAQSAPATGPVLFDPFLTVLAEQLEDIERTRIASENRYRQLTRTEADEDGEVRGFGLDPALPECVRVAAVVKGMQDVEHATGLSLNRAMRAHPLGAWCKATIGVGERQLARLLGVIGDPYWNTAANRPRTVSELWAYSGLHVVRTGGHRLFADQGEDAAGPDPELSACSHGTFDARARRAAGGDPDIRAGQWFPGTQKELAGSEQTGDDAAGHGQVCCDTQMSSAGVAPRRRRGERVNWSTKAKTRAYLIAESCIKQRTSPYRSVYEQGRAKYEESVHPADCARCHAKAGDPLRPGHQHARAMRLVMKAVLRDLWIEAKRLHSPEP